MIIKFDDSEKDLIKSVIKMKIEDPEPCRSCSDEDRRSCCGCPEQYDWTQKYSSLLDEFENLKTDYPSIDFDEIVSAVLKVHYTRVTLEEAHNKYNSANSELAATLSGIEDGKFLDYLSFLQ